MSVPAKPSQVKGQSSPGHLLSLERCVLAPNIFRGPARVDFGGPLGWGAEPSWTRRVMCSVESAATLDEPASMACGMLQQMPSQEVTRSWVESSLSSRAWAKLENLGGRPSCSDRSVGVGRSATG